MPQRQEVELAVKLLDLTAPGFAKIEARMNRLDAQAARLGGVSGRTGRTRGSERGGFGLDRRLDSLIALTKRHLSVSEGILRALTGRRVTPGGGGRAGATIVSGGGSNVYPSGGGARAVPVPGAIPLAATPPQRRRGTVEAAGGTGTGMYGARWQRMTSWQNRPGLGGLGRVADHAQFEMGHAGRMMHQSGIYDGQYATERQLAKRRRNAAFGVGMLADRALTGIGNTRLTSGFDNFPFYRTLAGGAAGVGSVNAARQMEDWRLQFSTIAGKQEGPELMRQLFQSSLPTPFSPQQTIGAGKDILGGVGDPAQVLSTVKSMMSLGALTEGLDLRRISRIVGKVSQIGRAELDDVKSLAEATGLDIFGQMTKFVRERGTDSEKARMATMDDSQIRNALRKDISAGKFTKDFMLSFIGFMGEEFEPALKDFSQTTSGLLSTLTGELFNMGTVIGEHLLPVVNDLVRGLTAIASFIAEHFGPDTGLGMLLGGAVTIPDKAGRAYAGLGEEFTGELPFGKALEASIDGGGSTRPDIAPPDFNFRLYLNDRDVGQFDLGSSTDHSLEIVAP